MPLNCAAQGAGLSKDASLSRPRVLLASLESECDYHGAGVSERDYQDRGWVPVALAWVRCSGAEELTLSDPEKQLQRVSCKDVQHPSEKLETPAVPSIGSWWNELWYIHSGESYPAAQKKEGDSYVSTWKCFQDILQCKKQQIGE